MTTRDELVAAIVERYGGSNRAERGQILNEFVAVTGFHRKHAARLLGGGEFSGAGAENLAIPAPVTESQAATPSGGTAWTRGSS